MARCAQRLSIRLTGPPEHPFRSVEALRTLYLFRREPAALRLAVGLSDACWGQGRRLTHVDVLRDVVDRAGLDATQLAERMASVGVKNGLRALTDEAVGLGVFGVPTFVVDGELFWGHDRLEHLAERLGGTAPPAADRVRDLVDRPRGADRKRPVE